MTVTIARTLDDACAALAADPTATVLAGGTDLMVQVNRGDHIIGNVVVLSLLTMLFQLDFLKIQWVGALVIGLFFICAGYMAVTKARKVSNIEASPKENKIDFTKIETLN